MIQVNSFPPESSQSESMKETAEALRHMIAQYRERLAEGESSEMVIFCIEAIREAEKKLRQIEREEGTAKSPRRTRSRADC